MPYILTYTGRSAKHLYKIVITCLLLIGISSGSFGQNPFEVRNRVPVKPDTQEVVAPHDTIATTRLQEALLIQLPDSREIHDIIQTQPEEDSSVLISNPFDQVSTVGVDSSTSEQVEEDKLESTAAIIADATSPINRQPGQSDRFGDGQMDNRNVLYGISIFTMLLLASLLALDRSLVKKTYRAIANDNYLRFLFREYKSMPWLYWLFYIHFFINGGFFIFLLLQHFNWYPNSSLLIALVCILFVMAVYLLKHFSLNTVAATFQVDKEANLYSFVTILVNILLGLALLPVNLLIAFGPDSIVMIAVWIGIALVILLYFFRQLKGLFISGRLVQSYLFHFFLYLCSAEIAPLLIVGKLALGNLEVY